MFLKDPNLEGLLSLPAIEMLVCLEIFNFLDEVLFLYGLGLSTIVFPLAIYVVRPKFLSIDSSIDSSSNSVY